MAYLLRPVKLLRLLSSGPLRRSALSNLRESYHAAQAEKRGVATVPIDEVVDANTLTVVLENFKPQHGNVTYTELLYLCMLTKAYLRPGENFLEIGTFDGNTISNIALNIPGNSLCYTIDLPMGASSLDESYLSGDKDLIDSRSKNQLKHRRRKNVQQFYSDSTQFDFSTVTFSGAFIDGAHHYEGVKKDSENVLRHIQRPGFVLWHDFYGYNDVAEVIYELVLTHRIRRIAGTNLCFLVVGPENERS